MSARRLSDLVRVVLAPNPSAFTLEGTNTYIVGERAPIVIDPGPNDPRHLDRVLDEAGQPGLVLLTHRHPDHADGAERFAATARASLAAFSDVPLGACSIDGVADGRRVTADGATLVAMHTPGHASDHLCFLLEEENALFTGDHILGRGTTVISHPDGELGAYLDSLERVRAVAPKKLYPGHGPVVEEPAPVVDYYISHRLERERQVLDAIDAGRASVREMVERIYADVDRRLHGAAALSVRAHLEKLRRDGEIVEEGGSWCRP